MFSWRKEKHPVLRTVDLVHKAMVKGRTKTKFADKARMKEQVVAAVDAHPGLQVKIGEPHVVPQFVKDKLKAWDDVRVLALEGSVSPDGDSSGHQIPVQILVHGMFPVVPPICFVTGDLYIPKWDASKTTLNTMIGTILLEFAQTRFISGGNIHACGPQVEGLVLSGDDDFDWASFEAARRAQEAAKPKAPPRKKRSVVHQVTDDTPSTFVCPISLEVMVDPVLAADGHSYEREEIESWLSAHSTSPLTNEEMPNTLLANTELQHQIHEYHRRLDPQYRERFLVF